jgi:hypothetical protein
LKELTDEDYKEERSYFFAKKVTEGDLLENEWEYIIKDLPGEEFPIPVKSKGNFLESVSVRKIGLILSLNIVMLFSHEFFPKIILGLLCSILSILLLQYMNWKEESLQVKNDAPKKSRKKKERIAESPAESDGGEAHDDEEIIMPKGPILRRETHAKADKKLKPGDTMVRIASEEHEKGTKRFGEWTNVLGDTFSVRAGPDYHINRKKIPSGNSIYEVIASDIFTLKKKVWHIGRFFDLNLLEKTEGSGKINGFPRYLIINVLAPQYAPGVFTNLKDGQGFTCTLFCKLSPESLKLIESNELSPSLKLFKRFFEESSISSQMHGRLKCIGRATNTNDLKFGRLLKGLVTRYNGTPLKIHDGEAEYFTGANYFEMTIDMHSFSNVTKNAFFQLKDMVKEIRSHFAFIIEGRENEELPEQLLAAVEIFNLTNLAARPLPVQILEDDQDD